MNSGTLKEILKVNILSLTKEEIESIMNEELEKAPEEMDTELIDMCLEILTGEPEERADEKLTVSPAVSEKKVKKFTFKKGILVAAVIILLISIAAPAGAKFFNIDVPENILKVYEDRFSLDTEGESQSDDLADILAENDLSDVVLPKFLCADCEIRDFQKNNDNFTTQVVFEYIDAEQKINGKVTLNISNDRSEFLDGELLINSQYNEAEQITVNGINVIVFNKGYENFIVYFVGGIEYSIELKGTTLDRAIEIASTL